MVEEQMDITPAQNNLEVMEREYQRTLAATTRQHRVDMIRIAQHTLIENARSMPADQREVRAEDVTEFASKLMAYIGD